MNCNHPADRESETLLLVCPDCGAECSRDQIGDVDLCYDPACPLHVLAGALPTPGLTPRQAQDYRHGYAEGFWDGRHGESEALGKMPSPEYAAGWAAGNVTGRTGVPWSSVVASLPGHDDAQTLPEIPVPMAVLVGVSRE